MRDIKIHYGTRFKEGKAFRPQRSLEIAECLSSAQTILCAIGE